MFGLKTSNEVTVIVDGGYEPKDFKLKANQAAKVTFKRMSEKGCLDEVIFNGEKRELPLNTPVTFDFTPEEKGKFGFSCGMEMVHGSYTVK
ncbi:MULTISPECIES: cupredoxin domain-containing protein [unclassified Lactococcus]|uniref:cupredoxin domain-containing protein n=1 Tax=unclassified Lactococcus TaxID=2643510 RepID=UPI0011CBAD97|nr:MULTISPECIES: cupredoxin domain-containing protein [unclassified Lactococcus]MQW23083.1 hypothetical protein [Lactococcus sp. dk101]TXK44428.1 hypothetical protein FVP42_05625 [Lactococcus sp. dk310]TXK50238.1 hypothetical protein FVP43_05595 [Lactococcus sp. dk322]